ncbi:acetolactate synthase 3 large subunit, partial [Salmonella enterica]|nr:acetolactate synthase 3 large subunit [Salmonella enterica]
MNDLARVLHEAFHVARTGRPSPVVIDIPKNIQFATGMYTPPATSPRTSYNPVLNGDQSAIRTAVELLANAKK